jgi:3-hydroxyacyl-[acyl-carrier-protein] dehydratase
MTTLTAADAALPPGDFTLPSSDEAVAAAAALTPPLDARRLLKILPHRYPFLLVDVVRELVPGERVVGVKNVTINEEFFAGHFPGHPIMPGVLVIEMMAQTAGVMLLTMPEHVGKLAYLAGVDKARFRKPVLPGDTLVASVSLLRTRSNVGWVKAETRVNDVLVCEAELSFSLIDRNESGL